MNDAPKVWERKKYEPPIIKVIGLRPEEAVLGHCKNASSAGPNTPCTTLGNCSTVGS